MALGKTCVLLFITLKSFHQSFNILAGAQAVNVTVLNPETLEDPYGNTADRNSNISFVDVANNQNYKSTGKTANDVGAIGSLYDLARSIVDTSLPGGFPFEWASKIKDEKIDITSDWKKIATDYLGYVIAVIIGIVFFVVFPIVGMCFCCCRCCGRCGGRRIIKDAAEAGHGDKCGRFSALSILAVFTTIALAGSILMFVTNSNLSVSLKDVHDKDIDKLDDITDFFDFTVQQAEQTITANFNFTLEVLFRDLDNIGYLLGIPIRDRVLINTGLKQTYDNIDGLESDAEVIFLNLQKLQENKKTAMEKSELFHNFTLDMNKTVEALATKNQDFNTAVPNRMFVTNFSASQLPNEDVKIKTLNVTLSQGISSLTAESKQNLNNIPDRVQNDTLPQRNDLQEIQVLKNDVNSYTKEITKVITDLKSMRDDVLNDINFDSLKKDAKDYTDKAKEYDQYRWYGGLGLAVIMTVTVLLFSLGILFGLFGGNASVNPASRGGLSNAGGNILIAGVIITFIFGWLAMFITTILFAVGAPAEKFGCGAAQDLSVFDKLVDEYELFGGSGNNGSWLGNKVYSGKNVVLKLSELMESCKKGNTVYLALKMEEANVFNLSDVTDYKKRFSIEDKLGNTVINFDSINITTKSMMDFIDLMKNFDSTMDYAAYNTTLSVNPVEPSKVFLARLVNFTTNYNFASAANQQEFLDVINQFNNGLSSIGATLTTSIDNIQVALNNIRNTTQQPPNNNLKDRCDTLERSLKVIEQNLSSDAAKAFNISVKDFETRLTTILDTFIADLENAIKNEIGICLPLWNMYSDVVVYGVCRSTIGAMSGWWCAIGWTQFFLTMSICAAVKLSKHFRRMTFASEQYPDNFSGKKEPGNVHHFQNKVFHSDKPNGIKDF